MKYIFFGTPEFAEIVLDKLIDAGYVPGIVVCNPDEPAGRKKIIASPPVKILAEKFNIAVLQPENLHDNSEFANLIGKEKPDLAVVAAYGKIIPKEILDIPSHGFLNVHGSLLPAYRGASPIQSAILNGEKETGVTIMKVDEKLDHGSIVSKIVVPILNDDTYESLSRKLAISGAELLIKTIPDYISGKIQPIDQNDSEATFSGIIEKEDGKIDWRKNAEEIERMIRAFYPWPTAWTNWNDKNLKILEADVIEGSGKNPGEVFLKNNEPAVQCKKDILMIKKLQLEGGKILSSKEFLNGHKDFIGSVLQ